MAAPQFNVVSAEGLTELNTHFLTKSYVTGFQASNDDLTIFMAMKKEPSAEEHPHLHRWFNHIKALLNSRFPGEAAGVTINNRPAKGDAKPAGESKKDKKAKAKAEAAPAAPKETPEEAAAKKAAEAEKMKAKLLAKVIKEGGKKGVEIAGAADMGGLEFFCTTIESPDGDIELLQTAMDAMNKEIDPEEEESKGGSGEVGKMIFSAGKEVLAVVAYAPKAQEKIDCGKWINAVTTDDACAKFKWEVVGTPTSKFALCKGFGNSDLGQFPIKMKDDAMTAAFKHLRENNAFPEDDGDDEDDYCYGDDAFDGM